MHHNHCVEGVQIRSFFWSIISCIRTECSNLLRKSSNTGKYGPGKTPYFDTFYAVNFTLFLTFYILHEHKDIRVNHRTVTNKDAMFNYNVLAK